MAVATSLRKPGKIQRLGNEVKCAKFERANGGFHVAVGGDHGDGHARRIIAASIHEIQAVAIGQLHVGQAQVESLGLEQALRRARR